ncbi:MAG: hypothetical protein A2481_01750 [Candidatus Yonathbacteria bacterium RIFOXYC2_FULL_47_9]|nr:MAG: hypothetical protein A2481_01750 [Candidatus Yonathbacteria bacterium RIFOXYC2_FULL_47_9]HAT68397.1 hypothetical protein [Candidatus Yonathbacteria bacterium]
MGIPQKYLAKFIIIGLLAFLGGTFLYFANKRSNAPHEALNYPNLGTIPAPATSSPILAATPVVDDFYADNGGVYRNTLYGYELSYPKSVRVDSSRGGSSKSLNELDVVGFSTQGYDTDLYIFAGLWETIRLMHGMGVDAEVAALYTDNLESFSQKIWKFQSMDFSHKEIESVTELQKVSFAGTTAYSFTATQELAPYIQNTTGNRKVEKSFLIFEHSSKKFVIRYTPEDSMIETIKNSFKFTEK